MAFFTAQISLQLSSNNIETPIFDDWLPILERVATWNGWMQDELQLAGYLKGQAL